MDIGTAKPTRQERDRVPHHLIDIADPDQTWSLALYIPRALEIISSIQKRSQLPFLVGGTGQYIQAVIQGWDLPDIKPDPALRGVLTRWADRIGVAGMRSRLEVLDPEAAAGIDGPNLRRIIRAMEVILASGKRFSAQRGKTGSPFDLLQIGLTRPRSELYERIDRRVETMLAGGFIEEVQDLLELGYSPQLPSLSAIGYKQIITYLQEKITLEEAVRQIKRKTRAYVRQQANWFREDDPAITWYSAGRDPFEEICRQIQQFLS
jgi:tRNA dimethylallyltransferase